MVLLILLFIALINFFLSLLFLKEAEALIFFFGKEPRKDCNRVFSDDLGKNLSSLNQCQVSMFF